MTYGAETVIPLETSFQRWGPAQLAYYQHKLKQGYDAKVKLKPLVSGDLVLRKVLGTAKNLEWGKIGPN